MRCSGTPFAGGISGSIPSSHSAGNRAVRALWAIVYIIAFRPSPKLLHGWRRLLLRLMGAHIARGAVIHPSVRIWAPWNLVMECYATLGPHVDCYNVAKVHLGHHATVSQYSYLCSATHNYRKRNLPLI